MKLNIIKLLIGIILISFTGIESNIHEEGSEVFIKNRPTFKFVYEAPRGSYEPIENLTAKEREDYDNYLKIVMRNTYSRVLDKISLFIILAANVLMVSGLVGIVIKKRTKETKLLLLDCLMQTSLLIFLRGFYGLRHNMNPDVDWRFYILIYFSSAAIFDYLIRREFTKKLQKQEDQQNEIAT